MLNLLPALLFLLVQGQGDPDARINRAEALVRLVASAQLDLHAPADTVLPPSSFTEAAEEEDNLSPNTPTLESGSQEHAQMLCGFGTSQVTRAGPLA